MASLLSYINRLLPFATPGTPVLQDVAHLAAICLLLYFAPQIQDWSRQHMKHTSHANGTIVDHEAPEQRAQSEVNGHIQPSHDEPPVDEHIAAHANGHAEPLEDDADDDADEDAEAEAEVEADTGMPSNGSIDRNVGAKKAKSLARKDQRRAYNEFMRSQGEAQRALDAEGAAEREAALEAERKRRTLAEAELAAKKAKEREQKREAEQMQREAEYQRRETAVAIVKADLLAHRMSDLHKVARLVGGDVDEEWVEKVMHASGILGRKEDVFTMITATGWAARIDERDARSFYQQAARAGISDEHGYMDDGKVSEMLVSILTSSSVAASA